MPTSKLPQVEMISLRQDIKVFYVAADSFPEGVEAAHQKMHALVPFSAERNYYGLSRPELGGPVVYRAAAEELSPGEAEALGCPTLILEKGRYAAVTIRNYRENIQNIARAFGDLLIKPGLDPEGYCIEWYVNDRDVTCMVRLKG